MFGAALMMGTGAAAGGSWSPVDLFAGSEVGGVYDPSDITTLWQDSDRTVPVTADGDPVLAIDDLSGNGLHMVQTDSALGLVYRDVGGLKYLEKTSANDHLLSGTVPGGEWTGDWHFAGGFSIDVGGGVNTLLFARSAAAGGNTTTGAAGIYQISTTVRRLLASVFRVGLIGTATVNDAFTLGAAFVGEAYLSGSTITAASNNTSVSAVGTTTAFGADRALVIFSGSNSEQGKFFGGVAIDRALTTDERDDVRQWIATRAGVTL